jgi:hypothetical protein
MDGKQMSETNPAAQPKRRWNAEHYTQVKISVAPELAAAFKAACATADVSMAGKLSGFMAEYSNALLQGKRSSDYATRRHRRASIKAIIEQLERIKAHEERYRDNIPENLQGSVVFDTADQCVSSLDEAIELLGSIY